MFVIEHSAWRQIKENYQIYLPYQFRWRDNYSQSAGLVLVSCIMIGTLNIENRKDHLKLGGDHWKLARKIGIIQQQDLTLASQFALPYLKLC